MPGDDSAGRELLELCDQIGMKNDPWQKLVLLDMCTERLPDRLWACFECGLIVGRQNGKGNVLEARQIGGVVLFGSNLIVHSAHLFPTAKESFRRLRSWFDNVDMLRKRVKKISESHGEEGIELLSGQRIRFFARARGGGRGFTGDDMIFDEAFNLDGNSISAMIPMLSAVPNPQIIYTSSAGMLDSTQLRTIRDRGRSEDLEERGRLGYWEWSAPEGTGLDDVDGWYMANPALGIRIREEFIRNERKTFGTKLAAEFGRERLGLWEDANAETVINMMVWAMLGDIGSRITGRRAFALDVTPERDSGCIAVAGARDDGLKHLEIVDHRPGIGWMEERTIELAKKWRPCAVVLDERAPVGTMGKSLEEKLRKIGIKLVITNGTDLGHACGMFYDGTKSDEDTRPTIRHLGNVPGQIGLTVGLNGVTKRTIGETGLWAWNRKTPAVDITPVVSTSLALWGFERYHKRGKVMVGYA